MPVFKHNCLECAKEYEAKRSTSRFCSAKCRQRHNRKHKNYINVGVECSVADDALRKLLEAPASELYQNVQYIESVRAKLLELDARINEYIAREFECEV